MWYRNINIPVTLRHHRFSFSELCMAQIVQLTRLRFEHNHHLSAHAHHVFFRSSTLLCAGVHIIYSRKCDLTHLLFSLWTTCLLHKERSFLRPLKETHDSVDNVITILCTPIRL